MYAKIHDVVLESMKNQVRTELEERYGQVSQDMVERVTRDLWEEIGMSDKIHVDVEYYEEMISEEIEDAINRDMEDDEEDK